MALQAGFVLYGRYTIEAILGQGGFGVVYKAHDQSLEIPCAIKENLNVSAQSERQFKREAALLATLRHPHLPRVTNHFILENKQYLVMDFIEGEDLKLRLERQVQLSEADVLTWLGQVGDALSYLHGLATPVIHRDIKPANIKITPSGEAILVDFGIAKVGTSSERTATGALGLTPGFAPPEQYNFGGTDNRTDIYALGATYYNLLTGHIPPESLQRLMDQTPLDPPVRQRPDLSPQVNAAVLKALEINVAHRFKSIGEFQQALHDPEFRYTPAKTATTRQARAAATARLTSRKRWPVLLAVGCLSLVGVMAAVGLLAAVDVLRGGPLGTMLTSLAPTSASLVQIEPTLTRSVSSTASPTASSTASPIATQTATALPTATPIPAPITITDAIGWRLFDHWQQPESASALALSPDGQQVVFLKEAEVTVCQLYTGECDSPVAIRNAFPNPDFLSVAFLDDTLLIQRTHEVIQVKPTDGSIVRRFELTGSQLSLSDDRRYFALRGERLEVYELESCQERCRLLMSVGDATQQFAFSPDSRFVAVAVDSNVDLWSLEKRQLLGRLQGHGEASGGIAFTPDSRFIVSAAGDIWDTETLKLSGYFDSATDAIAINLDSQIVAGRDGDMWDLQTGERIGSLPGSEAVQQMFFTPDGLFFVRQSATGDIQLWTSDPASAPTPVPSLASASQPAEAITPLNISRLSNFEAFEAISSKGMALNAAGTQLVTWFGNAVQIIDLPSRTVVAQFAVDGTVVDSDFLGTQFVLILTSRGQVERWDLARQKLMQRYALTGTELAGSPTGEVFVLSTDTVQVIEVRTGQMKYQLAKPNGFHSFLFLPDGRQLLVAAGAAVAAWDMETGKPGQRYQGHGLTTQGLALSSDAAWLVSTSGDIWNVATGERIAAFDLKTGAAALNFDGQLLLGGDGTLWDVPQNQYIGQIQLSASQVIPTRDGLGFLVLSNQSVSLLAVAEIGVHVQPPSFGLPALAIQSMKSSNLTDMHLLGWLGDDPFLNAKYADSAVSTAARYYGDLLLRAVKPSLDGQTITVLDKIGISQYNVNTGALADQFYIFLNPDDINEFAYLGQDLLILKEQAGLERWNLETQTLTQRYKLYGTDLTTSKAGNYFALREKPAYVSVLEASSGNRILEFRVKDGPQQFAFAPTGKLLAVNTGVLIELRSLPDGAVIRVLRGHTNRLDNLTFTPDGQKLVAGSGDVWDINSGELVAQFDPRFATYAVSPSGEFLAGSDGSFWDIQSGQRLATNFDLRDIPTLLLFAAGGDLLLGRTASGQILVWGVPEILETKPSALSDQSIAPETVAGLELVDHLNRGRLQDAVWSEDGRYLAVNTTQNVIVYEAATLTQLNSFLDARALAFDQDHQLLLGGPAPLQLIDFRTGEVVKAFGLDNVQMAAFEAEGHRLAIASPSSPEGPVDQIATIDLTTGVVAIVEAGLYPDPLGLKFVPGSDWLMVSFHGVMTFWSQQGGQWQAARPPAKGNVRAAEVSPDGTLIAYFTANNRLNIQNIASGFEPRSIGTELFQTGLYLPDYIPLDYSFVNNNQVAVFYRERYRTRPREHIVIRLWTLDTGKYADGSRLDLSLSDLQSLYFDSYALNRDFRFPAVVMSPDDQRFYSVTADGVLRVWAYPDGQLLAETGTDPLPLMALSPDGQSLALPNAIGQIEILSLVVSEPSRIMSGAWQVQALRYVDNRLLLVLGKDGVVSLINTTTGNIVETYRTLGITDARHFALDPQARLLAVWGRAASRDGVRLFPFSKAQQPLYTIEGFFQPDELIFAPDGRRLAVAKSGLIQIWDLQTWQLLFELKGNHRDYGNLVFTPDSSRLIAATGEVWSLTDGSWLGSFASTTTEIILSPDGKIIVGNEGTLWNADTLQPIEQMRGLRGPAVNFAFTPDGQSLLWQNAEGLIEIWRLP